MERPEIRYRAFGLVIRSSIELPELPVAPDGAVGIEINQGTFHHSHWVSGEDDGYHLNGEGCIMFPHETGWYRLSRATDITVEQRSDADPTIVRLVILGRAMGALLQWRGLLALHASAVALPDGRAVIFLGSSGAGKSTTAAAFVAAGYPLISDEIVAVDLSPGYPQVPPGYPALRLSAHSASILPYGRTLSSFNSDWKRYVLVHDFAHNESAPVGAIYALERGTRSSIEALSLQDGLRPVLANSYAQRLIGVTKTADLHLTQSSTLASTARVCRVTVNRDATKPADVVEMIERDLALSGWVQKGR